MTATRPTRGEVRRNRRAAHWASRMDTATDPAAKAAAAFDHTRARIKALPAGEQAAAWEALISQLAAVAPDRNSHANFARPMTENRAPTRPDARTGAHTPTRTRASA